MNILKRTIQWINNIKNKQVVFLDKTSLVDNLPPKEKIDWSISHGGFDKLGYYGDGERIAVLDTGVDLHHRDLQGGIDAYCFIRDCEDIPSYKDSSGHGTFIISQIVARRNGIGIIGVAPNATCFSGKILYGDNRDKNLKDLNENLSKSIDAAVSDGCNVISISLGIPSKSHMVEDSINNAVEKGVIIFASAGNEGMIGSPYKSYPASYKNVISVGSSNEFDLPHWYSSSGLGDDRHEQPEVSISSLEYYWGCLPGNKYGMMTGTSQACPIMAGVALLWRQAMRTHSLLPSGSSVLASIRKWLYKNTYDTNLDGWDKTLGYGVLKLNEKGINL